MLTKKAHTLNHVHPHLKDAAFFSSVSKAKASVAAPAAIRTSCANTWKMKLKKITETSKLNDTSFFFPCIETAETVLCLLENIIVAQWNRGNCGDEFCCLYACVQLQDLTLAYVLVAFEAFSGRVDERGVPDRFLANEPLHIFAHIYLLGMSVFKEPKMISQFSQTTS